MTLYIVFSGRDEEIIHGYQDPDEMNTRCGTFEAVCSSEEAARRKVEDLSRYIFYHEYSTCQPYWTKEEIDGKTVDCMHVKKKFSGTYDEFNYDYFFYYITAELED